MQQNAPGSCRVRKRPLRPRQIAFERLGAHGEPVETRGQIPHLDADGAGLLTDHHVPHGGEHERDRDDKPARTIRKTTRRYVRGGIKETRHIGKV